MKRRDLLQMSAAVGVGVSLAAATGAVFGVESQKAKTVARVDPLPVPADGIIPVAFLISEGAVIIDFTGPWQVFQIAQSNGHGSPFQLFTVAETTAPIVAGGGMTIVPKYSIANAPAPKVVVIPAQSDPTGPVLAWLRAVARSADMVMSVCSGAFLLAKTGLLSGKSATTFHGDFIDFSTMFPDIRLERGVRFVDEGNLATAGGLSSGIDLALHVVERYFGRAVASSTAYELEYQGQGWMDPNSNQIYAQTRHSTDAHPLCAVCQMDVDKATAPRSTFHGKTYYFCMPSHKSEFDSSPERFVSA
jgi:transcriptional regulator GlxA family with amidase domain